MSWGRGRDVDTLAGHVTLDVECLDRIYLNGYVPNLQVGGQVVQFLTKQGFPIPSSALIGKIGDRFREAVRTEAFVADDLNLGRPDRVELIFGRKVRSNTPGVFATRVVTTGVDVTINALYKHSRVKEYLKDRRALRIETVIGPLNSPSRTTFATRE